jgi:hypothetical protein
MLIHDFVIGKKELGSWFFNTKKLKRNKNVKRLNSYLYRGLSFSWQYITNYDTKSTGGGHVWLTILSPETSNHVTID